jgi:hypothetical protein
MVRAANLDGMPILVVSGYGSNAHLDQQRDMLELSSRSEFVAIEAGHIAMLVEQQSAQLVVGQVEDFLASL